MALQNDIPSVRKGDWNRLKITIDKLRHLALGAGSHPTYAGLTLSDLTASSLVGTNASKTLESVTIGNSLTYIRPTLDTIQDIRTTAIPIFAGAILNGTTAIGLDMSGGTFATAVQRWPADPTIQVNSTTIFHLNSANENLFLGYGTAHGDVGNHCVFVGHHAGYNNDTSGAIAGYGESLGTRNVYIGPRAGAGEIKLTGTVAATYNSTDIVGSGTSFLTEVEVGDVIRIEYQYGGTYGLDLPDYGVFEITDIADDTHLTIDSNFLDDTVASIYAIKEKGFNKGGENVAIGCLALAMNSEGYENTAIGDNALEWNTTGHGNVALGNDALQGRYTAPITGSFNTGIGTDTLYLISSGSYNMAVGYQALLRSTSASYNFAMGYQALYNTTTAQYDVALGYQAGYNDNGDPTIGDNIFIGYQAFYNDNGQYNVGIGFEVGKNNDSSGGGTDGTRNVYIGYQAGRGIVGENIGDYNVAIGYMALFSVSNGSDNFALGYESCTNITDGFGNVGIGRKSLSTGTINIECIAIGRSCLTVATGNYTVAIGAHAGGTQTSAVDNTLIGDRVAYYNQTGSYNVWIGRKAGGWGAAGTNNNSENTGIGYNSGYNITTGSSNIFIGYKSGYRQTTNSDLLIIDNQDRTSAALEITNSLIYGVFDATVTTQSVRFNVGDLTLASGTPYQTLWNTTHEDTDGGRESRINFKGEQSGEEETTLARIEVSHDGDADDEKGQILFSTNDGSDGNTPTFAMSISSLQRVGVGTDFPSLKFDVKGLPNTSYDNCPLLMQVHTLEAYAAGMGAGISLGGEYGSVSTATFGYIAGLKENAVEGDISGKLVFGTNVEGLGGGDFTKMTILSSGNVGIGVTDPHSKLEVAGAISSGTLTVTTGTYDDLDVSGVNALFIDTSGGAVIIRGTLGGVDGQVLYIAVHDATGDTIVHHEAEELEGAEQEFRLHAGVDETLNDLYGGWIFINMGGTHWHDCSHAKHVP